MTETNKPLKIKYISDLIGDEYKKWKNESVVFDAGTASGKTYFTLNVLSKYAKLTGKRMLYLCNRKKLRQDIQKKVQSLPYCKIDVISYQTLQKRIKQEESLVGYDYIIADEIHYLTSDSFNEYTDLTYKFLMSQKNNVVIYMSATAKLFFRMLLERNKVKSSRYYTIEKDYSYVGKVFFYKAKALSTLIDGILEKNPQDKTLVFCNSEDRMLEMHDIYKERAGYFCSDDCKRKELKEICNPDGIKKHSEDYITFDKQILFTTKVLDNGIDLKDTSIKHIFTELFDLDSMVQSLGRKRSLDMKSDTCDFYIKNYTPQGIKCFQNKVNFQLKPIKLLKKDEEEFNRKYGKDRKVLKSNRILYMNFGLKGTANNKVRTNGDVRINNMMYSKYCMDYQEINKMVSNGYISVVSRWLGAELSSKIEVLDISPEEKDLFLEYLESIKEKHLFKEEQNQLKNEFIKIGLKDRTMGINTLNGKLKDLKHPYEIKSKEDRRRMIEGESNPNRGKRYWMLHEILGCKKSTSL